ncbi:hypothetical protein ONA91_34620 [Micromonospora sp. DR5-3]|uniref:hypothetical protein n=1 Tax=unclassified Micromonospora TaxID=2617518 RepID=UPI0011D4C0B3|nr:MULTISPECIES: hypothetical protein [unclassified Micromonospora]MCW3819586.1 hypothetical protein [Micromonospora sp. DR5-3]TYC19961.1 hypothetical protein FXF52_33800 [Micromonospora sp. MP36]
MGGLEAGEIASVLMEFSTFHDSEKDLTTDVVIGDPIRLPPNRETKIARKIETIINIEDRRRPVSNTRELRNATLGWVLAHG